MHREGIEVLFVSFQDICDGVLGSWIDGFQIDFPGGVERGEGQSESELIEFRNLVGNGPTLIFMKRLGAGKERCGVTIRTQPQKDHVETRKAFELVLGREMLSQCFLIISGDLLRVWNLGMKTKDVFFGDQPRMEKLFFRLKIVTGAMVGWDMPFIAKETKGLSPRKIANRRDLPPTFDREEQASLHP